jgi:hypothetical protein
MKTNLIPMMVAAVLALVGAAARGEATLSLVDAADRATAVVDPAAGGVVAVRARIDAADGPVAGFDAEIALPSPLEVVEVGGTSAALGGAEVLAATNGLRANCISLDGGEPVSPTTGAAMMSFTVRVPAGTPEGRYEVGLGPRCGIYADGTSNTCAVAVAPLGVVVAATDPVPYRDPVGETTNVCASFAIYTGENTLTSGWWVVFGTVTNDTRIVVSGDVNLILVDGAELVAKKGVDVGADDRLAIWAQGTDAAAGRLVAIGGDSAAGIGGADGGACGAVAVNGGTIEASGCRAIGAGGGSGVNGSLSICTGARVTAGAAPVAATDRASACQGNAYAKIGPCGPHEFDGLVCRLCGADATCWICARVSGGHVRQTIGDDTAREIYAGVNPGDSTNILYTIDPWYSIGAMTVNGVTNAPATGVTGTYTLNLDDITETTTVVVSEGVDPQLLAAGLDPGDPYTPAVLNWLTSRYYDGELANPEGPISLGHHKGLLASDIVYEMPLKMMYWLDLDPTEPGWWLRHGFVGETGEKIYRKRVWNATATEHLTNRLVTVRMYLSNDVSQIVYGPYRLQGLGNEQSDSFDGNWTNVTFKLKMKLDNGLARNAGFLPFRRFTPQAGSFDDRFESRIEVLDPFSPSSDGYSYGWHGSACNLISFRFELDESLETGAPIEPLKADSTYDGPPFEDDEP